MISIHPIFLSALAAAMALTLLAAKHGLAAELVMLEQKGCAWCARFNAEIAPAYANAEQGSVAPLRRVDINEPIPDDLDFLEIERFTPTFVLIKDNREIGRIRGYPGDEFFWFLIDDLIAKLPEEPEKAAVPARSPAL